jgi:hypothetical protein
MVTLRLPALAALPVALLLACSGCRSAAEEWSYEKPRVTSGQLDRDLTQCAREARPTGPFAYPSVTGPDRDAFNRCMEKRGYTVIRRPAGS